MGSTQVSYPGLTPVSVHMASTYYIIRKNSCVAKVFKMAFGVWLFGVFAVLALLWLRRRREARRRAIILRKRSSQLRLLWFIAAQEEQPKFFLLLPYGRRFWQGIYFGGLAVLRAICQYFIRQKLHSVMQCDVIIIAKS